MIKISARTIVTTIVMTITMFMGSWGRAAAADACTVLVVNSYHETFFRSRNIYQGIEEVLGAECALTYLHLDAITEPAGVETKAHEAFLQYQAIQPDGVITMGEEAQTFFVVPHLRGKVETPVMFNNIFFPEMYEYPASNVSGIKVRWPVKDAIIFLQQLVPEVATIGLLFADEPSGYAVIEQIAREKETYSASVLDPVVVKTAEEAVEQAALLKEQCDALFIGPTGLLPSTGGPALSSEILMLSAIKKAFGKAVFANIQHYVELGLLCAVRDFGLEQGQVSAEMLQKAMSGTAIADLPITQNQFGQRIVNKTVLKEMGIRPSRQVLTGAEIVETRK